MSRSKPIVAFCGLGRMGVPMVRNLASAGVPLVLYNRTQAKAESLAAELGCEFASTPSDAARDAEVVITMVADGQAADDVYLGDEGLAAGLAKGALVIDMSTVGASKVKDLAALVSGAGGDFVDAPVSGSVAAATGAMLTIVAGGTSEAVERARGVLEHLGRAIYHIGPSGSGAIMKLAVNTIVFSLNQSISEALVFAERAGIDRKVAYSVFADSAVAAPFVHYRRTEFEEPDSAVPTFLLRLAKKDLDLALREANLVGARLPQTVVNRDFLDSAIEAGLGGANMTATADLLRSEK
jgi:3-hydroxyisobutyrate dehydrogenase-like beta-hydroxyacid dehydrogenase